MKEFLNVLRRSVERLPVLAESYRLLRDNLKFRTSRPHATPLGIKLMGRPDMERGEFEPEERQFITDGFAHVDVFVDVGANIGYYTCLARAANLQVVAFEPASTVLRFLCSNLIANGFRDVEVFPVGLSDRVEIATLYGGGGTASLVPGWSRGSAAYSATIPTTTMDHVLAGRFLDRQLFIKIDIEGVEYACLRGATETLARAIAPRWFVEIYLDVRYQEGGNPRFLDTFELFWQHGYVAHEAVRGGRRVERADVERWVAAGRAGSATPNYYFAKP